MGGNLGIQGLLEFDHVGVLLRIDVVIGKENLQLLNLESEEDRQKKRKKKRCKVMILP